MAFLTCHPACGRGGQLQWDRWMLRSPCLLCEMQHIEIVIINKGEPPTFEEELAQDVIQIIRVFSARLYGRPVE
jgi:predicted site-specific integrase-resolvase